MQRKLMRRMFALTMSASFTLALSQASEAQRHFSPRSRAAAMEYQRALDAQRRLYYQQERRLYAPYARRLYQGTILGQMGSTALGGIRSGGSLYQFGRRMGQDQLQDRGIQYGAKKFFNSPYVRDYNYRFWYGQ